MQQQQVAPTNRPGSMTAVMRAVSHAAGPKILRIGVVQTGKVIDERLIKERSHVTVGPSEKAMFVVPSRKIPPNFRLFELIGGEYYLNFLDGMGGRVALKSGIADISTLKAQAKVVTVGNVKLYRVRLTDDARGKVVIGETTFLFQFVAPPPVQPRPQLPVSVMKNAGVDIDWTTTIIAAFSFLAHFFIVALVYSDWMDPIVDDELRASQLIDSFQSVPRPVAEVPQKEEDTKAESTAAAATAQAGVATAPKQGNGGAGKAPGAPGKGGAKSAAEMRAEADAKAAEIESSLAALDVQAVGVMGAGVNTTNVLDDSSVPAESVDGAARSGSAAGSGSGVTIKGGSGSGTVKPGSVGSNDIASIGNTGTSDPNGGTAAQVGTAKAVEGPKGNVSASASQSGGGAVKNASSVVARMRGGFRRCYEQGLASDPSLQGSVTLVATIGPNGEVRSVSGGGGALGSIVGCLKGVVQSGAFAKPEDGTGAVISIPINFSRQ
ncbi:MAG: cell envelope integrity protein TolA [Myxococcales bacterium]|nr:cell envelope integrity protein TolA [Myxococcales bacterium]